MTPQEFSEFRASVREILSLQSHNGNFSELKAKLEYWTSKAAKLKLNGEHETYKWEYDTCLEKMALFQRLLDKRQEALLRSSNTKASP